MKATKREIVLKLSVSRVHNSDTESGDMTTRTVVNTLMKSADLYLDIAIAILDGAFYTKGLTYGCQNSNHHYPVDFGVIR